MLWNPHVGCARFRTTAGADRCQSWGTGRSTDGNTRNRPIWRTRTAAAVSIPDAASVQSKLSKLNDSQTAAAMHLEGPCRVIAGPGSGKTRVSTPQNTLGVPHLASILGSMHVQNQCVQSVCPKKHTKLQVLVRRIANLIESDVPPSQIMAITFTRKAGAEMKERLNDLLGPALCKQLTIGTYHTICGSILRRYFLVV